MNAELISVVLCTYNGEKFLNEQLQSIIDQTYPNLEIIIFDDASKDDTRSILQKYQHHSNIHISFNEKNIGFTKNFERAALFSKGNFICFADQDDIWVKEKIELLYKNIGEYSMIFSNSLLIDEEGKSLNKYLSDFRKLQHVYTSKAFILQNGITGHTMMMKREVLEKSLPLPENAYHDWWFAVVAANLSGIFYLDKVLNHYRRHTTTVTKTIVEKRTGSKAPNEKFEAFSALLKWIETLKNNPTEKNKDFFNSFYNVYSLKEKGTFSLRLFWFLIINRKTIFFFSKKNFLSQLVEIRKMARREKSTRIPFK